MNGLLRDIAGASLPVAVGLLILAVAALGVRLGRPGDARAQRLSALYLEPLATWSLVALATRTLALVADGRAGVLAMSVSVSLGLVAAAVLLWSADETSERPRTSRSRRSPRHRRRHVSSPPRTRRAARSGPPRRRIRFRPGDEDGRGLAKTRPRRTSV